MRPVTKSHRLQSFTYVSLCVFLDVKEFDIVYLHKASISFQTWGEIGFKIRAT